MVTNPVQLQETMIEKTVVRCSKWSLLQGWDQLPSNHKEKKKEFKNEVNGKRFPTFISGIKYREIFIF